MGSQVSRNSANLEKDGIDLAHASSKFLNSIDLLIHLIGLERGDHSKPEQPFGLKGRVSHVGDTQCLSHCRGKLQWGEKKTLNRERPHREFCE